MKNDFSNVGSLEIAICTAIDGIGKTQTHAFGAHLSERLNRSLRVTVSRKIYIRKQDSDTDGYPESCFLYSSNAMDCSGMHVAHVAIASLSVLLRINPIDEL